MFVCVTADTMTRNVDDGVLGFGGVRKFERDFQSSDTPSVTKVTDMQSATDESTDQSQSECDQPLSEHTSEAEAFDIGGEKLSRRKPTKLKTDTIPATVADREW